MTLDLNVEHRDLGRSSEGAVSSEMTRQVVHQNKKQGRGFFLTLLILSGSAILFLAAFFFKGREIHIFTFQKFVVNKAFVTLLPREYALEEAEAVRKGVYDFYDGAKEGEVSDQALFQVSRRIQAIMADEKITDEEVQELLNLIERSRGEK